MGDKDRYRFYSTQSWWLMMAYSSCCYTILVALLKFIYVGLPTKTTVQEFYSLYEYTVGSHVVVYSWYILILTHFSCKHIFSWLVAIWTQEVFSLAVSNTSLKAANELVNQCRPTTDTLTLSCEICLFWLLFCLWLYFFLCWGCATLIEVSLIQIVVLSVPVTSLPDSH